MNKSSKNVRQIFLVAGAIIGWLGVGLQFYLIIVNRVASVPETIIRFFSFFTILTNIIVALYFTARSIRRNTSLKEFFSRPGASTAITVYITLVGIVYQFLLRHLWNPTGLQLLVDELLHSFIPVYFIIYWFAFGDKQGLHWRNLFAWLLYPLLYSALILFRGELSGFYPYPFIDVSKQGFNKVILNSGGMMLVFIVLSVMFVSIAKLLARSSINKKAQ